MDQQQTSALCGVDGSVCSLIGLYCAERPPEKDMENWFAGIEFEALRPEVSCMAAAMAAASDYKGAPLELMPRLRGIIRYVHTLNSGMTAGLCALGKRYSEAGIPASLIGSTAVHLGYPKPPRRHMWQTEIGVSEADFPRAAALAADAGFAVQQTPYSATARCGNTQCVLIRKGVGFARETTALAVGGAVFRMPGSGELLVSLAEAFFQLLSGTAPGPKLIPWIMDLHCVIAADPDWKRAAAAAAEQGAASRVRLVLELYSSLAPNILSGEIPDIFGTEDAAARLAQLLLEYRDLKPGSTGLKRLWLSARIKNGDAPSTALGAFLKELCRAGVRRLTPGS